jgi:hypothetical protein
LPEDLDLFERVARAIARLNHPPSPSSTGDGIAHPCSRISRGSPCRGDSSEGRCSLPALASSSLAALEGAEDLPGRRDRPRRGELVVLEKKTRSSVWLVEDFDPQK